MEKINTTMYKTGQPPCPINILTFLMIPFCCLSPVCWMTERNHNKRLDGVNKAKQKFNEDYGKDYTLFESKNERQKIEPVPIPHPRASRNFPDVKTRNGFLFHNWTSEIIPFIRFGI